MTPDPSPEAWAQARYDYEHTDKPIDDICFELGVSPTTLRDRVRRWRWTRRRQPISLEGPPPMPAFEPAITLVPAMTPAGEAAPAMMAAGTTEPASAPGESAAALPARHAASSDDAPVDPAEVVPRLQGAVARVLPAIEATVAKLATGPMAPREMERAARTLTSLTRTLRELNGLLSEHQRRAADDEPKTLEEARAQLARRIEGIIAQRPGMTPPEGFVPYGA